MTLNVSPRDTQGKASASDTDDKGPVVRQGWLSASAGDAKVYLDQGTKGA